MESLKIHAVELDQCRHCRGVWLDHREIDELFALPKIPERFLNMEMYREAPEMVEQGQRICPRCEEQLKLIEVDGIELDACSACKGFFADLGELRKLAEAAEARYARESKVVSKPKDPLL